MVRVRCDHYISSFLSYCVNSLVTLQTFLKTSWWDPIPNAVVSVFTLMRKQCNIKQNETAFLLEQQSYVFQLF